MQKPVIVIVADKIKNISFGLENKDRLALIYNCEQSLGCEVFSDFTMNCELIEPEKFPIIDEFNRQERLAAIVIFHSEFEGETTTVINKLYNFGLHSVPIIVVAEPNEYEPIEPGQHEKFIAFSDSDLCTEGFWKVIEGLVKDSRCRLADKDRADSLSIRQLQQAYETNYGEDQMLSAIDDNTKAVCELIRMRLMQDPVLIRNEFDQAVLNVKEFCGFDKFDQIPQETYDAELGMLINLDEAARTKIDEEVNSSLGQGSYSSRRAGLGEDCFGFAFDPETYNCLMINEFGLHRNAWPRLADRIMRIVEMKKRKYHFESANEDDIKYVIERRLIKGILIRIPSLQTPLLIVVDYRGVSDESINRAMEFFKLERRFIAIDSNIRPIPGQTD